MAYIAWQATVQDELGNAVVNPVVTVRNKSDLSLATVYSDDAGTALSNPINGGVDGFVQFWASAGTYIIEGADGAATANDWEIELGTPTIYDDPAAFFAAGAVWANGTRVSARTGEVWDIVASGEDFTHPVSGVGVKLVAYNGGVSLSQLGVFDGSGVSISEPSMVAMNSDAMSGGGSFRIPAGVYTSETEIKIPSRVRVVGAGIDVTTIVASASMPSTDHTFTNSGNNRISRVDYDVNISISDLTINSNAWNRSYSGTYDNKGSSICLSTVSDSYVSRVKVKNSMLHGIDVMASTYLDDGDITSQPDGPSLRVDIQDCVAENTRLDDGFTTHNSGFINITGCRAYFDRTAHGESGSTQQGFELDEGSYNIVVSNCDSIGWTKAYQVKGHPTTKAARDITLRNIYASQCAYGVDIDHNPASSDGNGGNVLVDGLRVGEIIPHSSYTDSCPFYIRGYDGVTVLNVYIESIGVGKCIISGASTGSVVIDGVRFEDAGIVPVGVDTNDHPLIQLPSILTSAKFSVKNVSSYSTQLRPVVWMNNSDVSFSITDIDVVGGSSSLSPIRISSPLNTNLFISGINSTGWGGAVYDSSTSTNYANDYSQDYGRRIYMSNISGSPEGITYAPQGTILRGMSTGRLFRKDGTAGNVNTGWLEIS